MVFQMSENKRYVQFEFPYDDFAVRDNQTNEELWNPRVVDRLNEQDNRIKELENELELYKHYVEFVPSSSDIND